MRVCAASVSLRECHCVGAFPTLPPYYHNPAPSMGPSLWEPLYETLTTITPTPLWDPYYHYPAPLPSITTPLPSHSMGLPLSDPLYGTPSK